MRAETEAELIEAVAAADAAGEPVLVLGGGSNLVVADEGFAGHGRRGGHPRHRRPTSTTTSRRPARARRSRSRPASRGTRSSRWPSSSGGPASRRWPASPASSAPPRSRTSAPTARRSARPSPRVRVWDRKLRGVRTFAAADCGFGYRTSRFKQDPGRHVVLDVTFQLRLGTYGAPLEYAELARTLNLEVGQRALDRVGARGRARAAHPQGHGARPGRPRHLVGRLVLHQPGPRARRACPRAPRPGRSPTAP